MVCGGGGPRLWRHHSRASSGPTDDGPEATARGRGGDHALEFSAGHAGSQDCAGARGGLHCSGEAGGGYAAHRAGAGAAGRGSRPARRHRQCRDGFAGECAKHCRRVARGRARSQDHLHGLDGRRQAVGARLGGNAPFLVFEDADLDAAVEGLLRAKFRNGGQTCVSPNRVYVHEAVYESFARRLVQRVAALRVGPATREESQIGPMINGRAVEKIERHVRDALERGAALLTGGRVIRDEVTDGPNYYAPTVLGDASHDMELASEETFGPVVALFRFRAEEEVVRQANDTPYGLAAYFYSRDVARIWRVAERLETGIVGINEAAFASESAPVGGVKESGYGREGSRYGLDEFLATKYLCQGGLA